MSRNRILIGSAEVIDTVRPEVREMLAESGVYMGRDTENPEYTIPLSVHDGKVFSMKEDSELDPERFLPTAQFHGPYFGDPNAGAAMPRERLRAALKAHYLYAIECDHEAKTDVPRCSCSQWPCDPQPSIGAAVDRWIEHFTEQLYGKDGVSP